MWVNNTYVIVKEEEIPILLYEKNKQIPNTESDYPKFLTVPSGKFKFEIPRKKLFSIYATCIEDTSATKLEEKIISIITKIESEAISIKEDREEMERIRRKQEEEQKRRELEEQKKRELAKKREKERKELKAAFLSAEYYSWANILRAFVEKYESFLNEKETIDDEDKEKLNWLKRKIEWLDPFIECDDELLSEEDKQNLIHSETDMKDNRATYHSYSEMYQEFTFWNNPFRRRK